MPTNIVKGFNVGGTTVQYDYESLADRILKSSIANEYSSLNTYKVDDYVLYAGQLYRCIIEITTPQNFDSSKWEAVSAGSDLKWLKKYYSINDEIKQALLDCFAHCAWIDEHGQDYYNALETVLYRTADLDYITAVFNQGLNVIYNTDSLDTLKQYLTVTAYYSDGTDGVITGYTLSGTLTVGTSTVTVSYSGKTTTFDVVVSDMMVNDMLTLDGIQNTRNGHNASATTWEDLSGNNNDFAKTSSASLSWGSDHAIFDATNRVMKCVADMQGSGNNLTIEIIAVNTGNGTWHPSSTAYQGLLLSNTASVGDTAGQFKFYSYREGSTNGLSSRYGSTSTGYTGLPGITYIAYVFNGTTCVRYVNGVSAGTVNITYQSGTKSQNWAIGGVNDGSSSGAYYNGRVYRIGISASAMTAEEIAERHTFFASRFSIT